MRERLESIWQDIRYAARHLMREPATTGFILLTLALGIGVNVSAFSVVDHVLLAGPQHVREAGRLVRLYSQTEWPPQGTRTMPWLPHSAFTTLRDNMQSVEAVGAYRVSPAMLGSGAASDMRTVSMMSSDMFGLLGVAPLRGRFYGAAEDADAVAVLSATYWRTTLAADPDIVGKSLAIDDKPYVVVGIAPAGFTGAELGRVDAWTPIDHAARTSMNVQVVARLRPAASMAEVSADVARLRPQVEAGLPRFAGWLKGARFLAAPIRYDATARESFVSVMAGWLAGISLIILLISCASVANLQLARLARRRRELAVRVALGAGRARVARLLTIEGVLLAGGAAIVGLFVIALIEPVVQAALFPAGSWAFTLLDARIIGVVAMFSAFTALLVAVAPSIKAGSTQVNDALRDSGRAGESRSTLRSGLTIIQAILSVVLLAGAGLFLRSLQQVNAVDLGMEPERVLTVELRYPEIPRHEGESYEGWHGRSVAIERSRHRHLVEVARRVAGVERAAAAMGAPAFHGNISVSVWVPGRDSVPALPGGGPYVTAVGQDYFSTLGTTMRRGRGFEPGDREGSEAVVVVNEAMARTLWPGEEAIGSCLHIQKQSAPCARIVGVAADVHRSGLKEEASMQYYVPIGQESGFGGSWLVIRPRGAVSASWPALREALQAADPEIRTIDVRVLSRGLDEELRPYRLGMIAFGLSASLALIVAGLGLYSVMAHAVAWRRHEIGVRLALGAQPSAIAALVVGHGTALATIGIGVGLLVVLGAGRWIEPLLFETSAADPFVLIGVAVLLEAVAIAASWLPARRAVGISPTEALRGE